MGFDAFKDLLLRQRAIRKFDLSRPVDDACRAGEQVDLSTGDAGVAVSL